MYYKIREGQSHSVIIRVGEQHPVVLSFARLVARARNPHAVLLVAEWLHYSSTGDSASLALRQPKAQVLSFDDQFVITRPTIVTQPQICCSFLTCVVEKSPIFLQVAVVFGEQGRVTNAGDTMVRATGEGNRFCCFTPALFHPDRPPEWPARALFMCLYKSAVRPTGIWRRFT